MIMFKILLIKPKEIIDIWINRIENRKKLKVLSNHLMHDIGYNRWEIRKEVNKPFWVK